MRKLLIILFLLLLGLAAVYFYYIRGLFISPRFEEPQVIQRGGKVKIYKWEEKNSAPTKRDHLATAIISGMLYIAGGKRPGLSVSGINEILQIK